MLFRSGAQERVRCGGGGGIGHRSPPGVVTVLLTVLRAGPTGCVGSSRYSIDIRVVRGSSNRISGPEERGTGAGVPEPRWVRDARLECSTPERSPGTADLQGKQCGEEGEGGGEQHEEPFGSSG